VFPRRANCLTLLRYSEIIAQHSSFAVPLGLRVYLCFVGADDARLRKCYTTWWLAGVTVRSSDLRSNGRGIDSRGRAAIKLSRSTQPSIPPG